MKRNEVEHLNVEALFNIMVDTHGITKANDLVSREFARIVSKYLTLDKILEVKQEACKRVLSGHEDRKEILINKNDLK